MTWHERERLFYLGSAFSLIPALAFLPSFATLIFHPTIAHAGMLAVFLFPALVAA